MAIVMGPNHPDNNKPPPLYLKNLQGKTPYRVLIDRLKDDNPFDPNLEDIRAVAENFKYKKKAPNENSNSKY